MTKFGLFTLMVVMTQGIFDSVIGNNGSDTVLEGIHNTTEDVWTIATETSDVFTFTEEYSEYSNITSFSTDSREMNTKHYADSTTPCVTDEVPENTINPVIIAYWVTGIIGIAGNLVVVVIIFSTRPMLKKIGNYLIINQSLVDIVASLVMILQVSIRETEVDITGSGSRLGQYMYCILLRSQVLMWSMYTSSTYNLVAIAIDRYLEVKHPIPHRNITTARKVLVVIASTWLIGPLIAGSTSLPFLRPVMIGNACWPQKIFPTKIWAIVVGLAYFTFQFLIPVIIMSCCYLKIGLYLRKKVTIIQVHPAITLTTIASHQPNPMYKKLQSRNNAIKACFLATLAYFVCWVFVEVNYLCFTLGVPLDLRGSYNNFAVIICTINCCINPFIYAYKYEEFKRGLESFVCKRMFKRYEPTSPQRLPVSSSSGAQQLSVNQTSSMQVTLHSSGTSVREGLRNETKA